MAGTLQSRTLPTVLADVECTVPYSRSIQHARIAYMDSAFDRISMF
jgi:hypothetical protein